jgi:hypothetical protein
MRNAFVEYQPCSLLADICKTLCCEFDIAENKFMFDWRRNYTDISAVGITGLVVLLFDGFHIKLNDYKYISMIFAQMGIK